MADRNESQIQTIEFLLTAFLLTIDYLSIQVFE